MARIIAVLTALGRVEWRQIQTFQSITGQNFFLLVVLIGLQPESAAFFGLILAALLLFPLSSDPLEKIPADRHRLWPLSPMEWIAIRAASIFLSPVIWIAAYLLMKAGVRLAAEFAMVALVGRALTWAASRVSPRFNLLRFVPAPPGVIGHLMRLHWREMLTTLDPYIALLISGSVSIYRLTGSSLNPAALPILSMIVVVAISTSAQTLIGLDGAGALRYSLIPIHGWQILLAKDAAFMILLVLIAAPLDILPAFTGGLAALAIGHHRSVSQQVAQKRWRFTSGVIWPTGVFQMFAIFASGNAVLKFGPLFLAITAAAWLASLLWYARAPWDTSAK